MRRRRRRFVTAALAVAALGFVVPTLAWCALCPWWLALALSSSLYFLLVRRVRRIFSDPRRPTWTTRLVDEPLFWQWGAGMFALPLLVGGLLGLSGLSVIGCAPGSVQAGGHATLLDAALSSFAAGLALSGWGIWGRRRFVRVREIQVPVDNLPAEFDGYRIAHLSDLHIGSYDRRERGLEWVRKANALGADLAVVTGDLVTSGTEYYADAAMVIGELSAKDGVYVSLGNHDQWDPNALTSAIEAHGPTVLRNRWVRLERDGKTLCLAGLDDAFSDRDDLGKTLEGRPEGIPTLLLSHYPSRFREASRRGVDVVLSGHTHGGQLAVPFFADRWNLSSLVGQASHGVFRQGRSTLYVSAGLGTTGPPMRLGVAPEIAVIVLRRA